MKTKTIKITVNRTVGLPKYSSKRIEITEEVELQEDESRKEVRDQLFKSLNNWVDIQAEKIQKALGD
jgi:hypothetical protein